MTPAQRAVLSPSLSSGFPMATTEWTLGRHQIRLTHNYWSGVATITVDDEIEFERRGKFIDYGFAHRLYIDGIPVAVRVITNGITFRHEMLTGIDAEDVQEANSQPVESIPLFVFFMVITTLLTIILVLLFLALCGGLFFLGIKQFVP